MFLLHCTALVDTRSFKCMYIISEPCSEFHQSLLNVKPLNVRQQIELQRLPERCGGKWCAYGPVSDA